MNKDNENGGYWKGTVDEKLDYIIKRLDDYHEDLDTVKSKINWIIGVGTGAAFVIGTVLAVWKIF